MSDDPQQATATDSKDSAPERPRDERRISIASTILPDYESSEPPPSYSRACGTDVAQGSSTQRNRSPQAQSNAGSCGVPLSMIQGVLGTSNNTSAAKNNTNKRESRHSSQQEPFRSWTSPKYHHSGSSARWNAYGAPITNFGNPFRRSGRK